MPEIVTENVGLAFSKDELEIMMQRNLDFFNDNDFMLAAEFIEQAFDNNEFENLEWGRENHQIDEISGCEDTLCMVFSY